MTDKKLIEPGKWYAEFDSDGNATSVVYDKSFRHLLGYTPEEYSDTQDAWTASIYSEDAERVDEYFNDCISKHPEGMDYDIEYRMKSRNGYRWFHDYGHVTRREDGSVVRIDGVVFDIQDTVSLGQLRKEQIAKMAGGVSSYIVNPYTERFQILTQDEHLSQNYPADEDFASSISRYIANDVYESDRESAREEITVPKIAAYLEKEDEYVFRYRDISSGYPKWYEMRAVKLSDTEILYGFSDKDEEIIEELIFNKIRESYSGLYYINLDTELAQLIKSTHADFTGGTGSVIPCAQLFKNIAAKAEGEEAEFLRNISNIECLKSFFANENQLYKTYKSAIFEDKWLNAIGLCLSRHSDGTPAIISMSFSPLDEDSSSKEEAKRKLAESMEVVGGLASEYTALYHVNLDTDDYVPYYLNQKVNDIRPYFYNNPKFVKLAHEYAGSSLVSPEDRDTLYAFYPSAGEVKKKLRDKKRMSILFRRNYGGNYLWTEAAIVKCEGENEEAHNVIVGFAEKDQEVRERSEQYEENAKTKELVDNIISKYNLAYSVNLKDGSFEELRLDESIVVGQYRVFENFAEVREFFLASIIHPSDVEFMRQELDYSTIANKISQSKSYSIEYRTLVDGISNWNEMNVTLISGDNVAIGFYLNDLDITKKHLEEKKFDEYLALFVVDLDTEKIKPIKTSTLFKTANVSESVPYGPAMKKFASIYEGETREFFNKISEIEHVKKQFADSDKVSFSYKAVTLETSKWIDVTGYVILRHEDGTPALSTLGFSLSDALATERQELQAQINEDMYVIGGLASGYETLYYINIKENLFKIVMSDGKKTPEAKQLVREGVDAFDILRKFGNSKLIHPDDRHLFDSFSVESIREQLAHSKRFHTRFRRNFKGEFLWYEMEVIKYEDTNEPPNAIAVGFASRDAEIRTEQAMNDCFGILGKEISPQESIDSLLELVGDYYGAERAYIFEFSLNNAQISNTYEWCHDGIAPMISELQEIPSSEIEGWMKEFRKHGAFCMDSLDTENAYGSESGRELLEMQGIDSLIAAPIMNEDSIIGFIGVDNPSKAKDNVEILKTVAIVSFSEILKRKENDEEHITLNKLTDAFVSVYYTDLTIDYMRTWKIAEEYKDEYGKTEKYSTSMGGYVRERIAKSDRKRCELMTSPEYVLEQFKTKDRFSIEMTDIMLGYERNFVFDYIKVNPEGTQLVICCRDITETLKKEREQQKLLEEARKAAEQASESKTSFLFNMSHDIRTPMNAITGFTGMAKKYIDDKDRVVDYLEKIDTSGMQLLSLVNQVLEMARIESGKVELEEDPVNILDEYNSMVVVLAEQAVTNGLEFNHSLINVTHSQIFADRARMSSITLNIAGNAMKYTPRGGCIDFTLKEIPARKEDCASFVFTVKDTGIGMSEEYLKVLFEPFTREKSSTVSKIQGTGLGMSIVKELVDLMGGNIEVWSEIGKGTRFDITIDFKIDNEDRKNSKTGIQEINMDFEGLRVLLVEDNELNREIAMDILNDEGLVVEEAEDGTVAVERMKEKGPDYYDFILMDIQMPIMNGYDATRAIKAMYPDMKAPIIALSANAFSEDRERSLAAGMAAHISKPINVIDLLTTLAEFR